MIQAKVREKATFRLRWSTIPNDSYNGPLLKAL